LEYLAGSQHASPEVVEDIARHYRDRLASLKPTKDDSDGQSSKEYEEHRKLSRELLKVEREAALRLRLEGRISDEALREIERDLDLSVLRLNSGPGSLAE